MKRIVCIILVAVLIFGALPLGVAAAESAPEVKVTFIGTAGAKLAWTTVSGADGYAVYSAPARSGKYSYLKLTSSASCALSGLKLNTPYYYIVRAYRVENGKKILGPCSKAVGLIPRTAFYRNGALSVKGSQLMNKNGAAVQLKGLSTHGLSWYPQYANRAAILTARDGWNANVIRAAVYTAEYNGYCTGDDANRSLLKKRIDNIVASAKALGMYAIIDWHILSDGDPNTYKTQAIAFFKEMAAKYRDCDNVIYEICNEPNGVNWSRIKSYAESVIKTIRAIDSDAVIIVGTPTWSQDVDAAAQDPITGYGNVMYALHFYAGTHKDALRAKLTSAHEAGLPVFVSEFGISEASGAGAVNTAEGNKWVSLLNKYKVSYVMWNFSNKAESSALIKSSCKKLWGWPLSELTDSGRWFAGMMRR